MAVQEIGTSHGGLRDPLGHFAIAYHIDADIDPLSDDARDGVAHRGIEGRLVVGIAVLFLGEESTMGRSHGRLPT